MNHFYKKMNEKLLQSYFSILKVSRQEKIITLFLKDVYLFYNKHNNQKQQ
jgi:hypothetical protein